ncbi:MAG: nickel-dependent hydrogenase large subunit [Candidatus Bathyarchaeia archaeon]
MRKRHQAHSRKAEQRDVFIAPMTRIEGHLDIHARADLKAKNFVEAHSYSTMFSGFEIILKGREPADAIWITQRICGVCPVPHATAAAGAVDMAYQAPPPPMGIAFRDFVHAAEEMYDSPLIFILVGPDYSQSVVEKLNPDWWKEGKKSKAERADVHGYATIADIMKALNPIAGELWLRSLEIERLGRKMATLFGAKHPHIQTFIPGGITQSVSPDDLEKYAAMLSRQIAYSKEFIPIIDDLCDFLVGLGYGENGVRPSNLISFGAYDDPLAYNARYEDMKEWGERRKVTPGVVIDGKLVTTDLVEINLGIREFIAHSYYDEWAERDVPTDPLGNEVPKDHPWNKETRPKPGPAKVWDDKYSWCTAPRWHDWKRRIDGGVYALEAGAVARLWATAAAKKVPESTGKSIRFTLPKTPIAGYRVADEVALEWKIPAKVNTLERLRARAYFHSYSAYVAYNLLLAGLELVKKGEVEVWNPYKRPSAGVGFGPTEAFRGALGHWVVMRNGKVHRYQVITPSTWNASPRDADGRLGPYEEAIVGTPITEVSKDELQAVDVVRTVRSFDPCLGCGVHVYVGDRVIVTDINHHH